MPAAGWPMIAADDAIFRQCGADPTDVDVHRADRPAADNDRAEGGIVGDRVGDRARDLGSVVNDFERGDDILGRSHHVIDAPPRAFEVFAHHEGQFDFETRLEETTGGIGAPSL